MDNWSTKGKGETNAIQVIPGKNEKYWYKQGRPPAERGDN
jgi:hypothetical protein